MPPDDRPYSAPYPPVATPISCTKSCVSDPPVRRTRLEPSALHRGGLATARKEPGPDRAVLAGGAARLPPQRRAAAGDHGAGDRLSRPGGDPLSAQGPSRLRPRGSRNG